MISLASTSIVLIEPSLPENVGAVARAMRNMGFARLRLVLPQGAPAHLSDPARRMSAGSELILEEAAVYSSIQAGLSDLQLTVGCTARQGKARPSLVDPRSLPSYLESYPEETKLGLVFGREDRGLTNQELDLCNVVLTIPTAPENPSLNLAQAVLVVCYEIRMAHRGSSGTSRGSGTLATAEELEGLFQHARSVLLRVGFLDLQNPERMLRVLRRILGRARPNSREVKVLRGVLRQIDWHAKRLERATREILP